MACREWIELRLLCTCPWIDVNVYHGYAIKGVPASHQTAAAERLMANGLVEVVALNFVRTPAGERVFDIVAGGASEEESEAYPRAVYAAAVRIRGGADGVTDRDGVAGDGGRVYMGPAEREVLRFLFDHGELPVITAP
jgi:hypothetical protein